MILKQFTIIIINVCVMIMFIQTNDLNDTFNEEAIINGIINDIRSILFKN